MFMIILPCIAVVFERILDRCQNIGNVLMNFHYTNFLLKVIKYAANIQTYLTQTVLQNMKRRHYTFRLIYGTSSLSAIFLWYLMIQE